MGFYAIHETQPRRLTLKRVSPKTHTPDRQLHISGYRYYNPEIGRWINRDPIGERGSLNVYACTLNIAISKIDILGLFPSPGPLLYPYLPENPRLIYAPSFSDMLNYAVFALHASWARPFFPDAALFLDHYLLRSGRPMFIRFGRVLNAEPALKSQVSNTVASFLVGAQSMPVGTAHSSWVPGGAGSSINWILAIGDFHYAIEGDVNGSIGGSRGVALRVQMIDHYDFNYTSAAAGLGLPGTGVGPTDSDARRLHDTGLAREFLVRGSTAKLDVVICGRLSLVDVPFVASSIRENINFDRNTLMNITSDRFRFREY